MKAGFLNHHMDGKTQGYYPCGSFFPSEVLPTWLHQVGPILSNYEPQGFVDWGPRVFGARFPKNHQTGHHKSRLFQKKNNPTDLPFVQPAMKILEISFSMDAWIDSPPLISYRPAKGTTSFPVVPSRFFPPPKMVYLTMWWFQISFIFISIWGNDPI